MYKALFKCYVALFSAEVPEQRESAESIGTHSSYNLYFLFGVVLYCHCWKKYFIQVEEQKVTLVKVKKDLHQNIPKVLFTV